MKEAKPSRLHQWKTESDRAASRLRARLLGCQRATTNATKAKKTKKKKATKGIGDRVEGPLERVMAWGLAGNGGLGLGLIREKKNSEKEKCPASSPACCLAIGPLSLFLPTQGSKPFSTGLSKPLPRREEKTAGRETTATAVG